MSTDRSRIADFAYYLLVRFIVCIVQILSYEHARRMAHQLAWLVHWLDRRHRRVANENLCIAFGDQLDANQRERTIREIYTHFCLMIVEMIHLPRRMYVHNWKEYGSLEGGDRTVAALLSGRPLLIVTGHLGNWEVAGIALNRFGFSTYAIARPLDNPYLEEYSRATRERTGQTILAKKGEFDQIQGVLEEGGIIATLADQDAGQRGQFVPFFGRPASTHKAPALLALEYNTPLLVIGVPKLGEAELDGMRMAGPPRYRITCVDYIDPAEYANRPDAVAAITARYTLALEKIIRLAPEQYFWLHRRWKHQPKVREKKKQAA